MITRATIISEPAMRDLTKRLIALRSENPPGNEYEERALTLSCELERLGCLVKTYAAAVSIGWRLRVNIVKIIHRDTLGHQSGVSEREPKSSFRHIPSGQHRPYRNLLHDRVPLSTQCAVSRAISNSSSVGITNAANLESCELIRASSPIVCSF